MTGSLQIKNDKYYAVLNTYDEKGNRKMKWINTNLPTKGNKREAMKFLQDQIREYELKAGKQSTDMLFSDAIRFWLQSVKHRIDPITYQGYVELANLHVLPYFDELGIHLMDLDRRTVQKYIDEKAEHGRIDGKGGLSTASLKQHKNILYQSCKEAIINDYLSVNPCENVILPAAERYEYHFYSSEQIGVMLNAIKDDPLYPLIHVTCIYGLRRSEVLGLKWDSIDFTNRLITIKHTVCKQTTLVEKNKTKNKSSYRSFPLLPDIEELLLKEKRREEHNRALCGREYHECDYIFKWDNGFPFSPDYVTHHFSDLLKKHDLPHIRFHELRHSCASMLIVMGFTLKDVQEWLGHSDIKMTANTYSHLDLGRKTEIGDSLVSRFIQPAC